MIVLGINITMHIERIILFSFLKLTLYFIYIFRYFDDTLLGLFDNRAASYIAATELGRPIVWTHLRNDWDDSPLGL